MYLLFLMAIINSYAANVTDYIQSMQGCYDVVTYFQETEWLDPNYPIRSPEYEVKQTQWIVSESLADNEIHLQHLTILTNGSVEKQIRQEWLNAAKTEWIYVGNATWKKKSIPSGYALWQQKKLFASGQLQQQCNAAWVHNEEEPHWTCSNMSPVPEREERLRSDYNMLDRTNHYVIRANGWSVEKENHKIDLRAEGAFSIATEKGISNYRPTDPSRCEIAKKWWQEHQRVWNDIHEVWKEIYTAHEYLSFVNTVNGKTLQERLDNIEQNYYLVSYDKKAFQKLIRRVIHEYFKDHGLQNKQ